jgi:hypothetical protein
MNPSPALPLKRGGIINRKREGAKETDQIISPQFFQLPSFLKRGRGRF